MTTATRIARGTACLAQNRFDLVLLDLSLPDGAGIAALRRARCAPFVVLDDHHDEAMYLEKRAHHASRDLQDKARARG